MCRYLCEYFWDGILTVHIYFDVMGITLLETLLRNKFTTIRNFLKLGYICDHKNTSVTYYSHVIEPETQYDNCLIAQMWHGLHGQ